MNKPKINQEVYEQYLDATVALFMEHYSAMLTEKVSSEGKDEEVAFPEALDLKCKALIKKEASKQKQRTLWKHTRRALMSAAAFAIAVLTTFSLLFVSVEAFRVRIINFYIENKNGYWSINSDQDLSHDKNETDTVKFDINNPLNGLISAEYNLVSISNADPERIISVYENSSSEKIRFLTLPYDTSLFVDTESADLAKELKILDFDAVFSIKKEKTQIAWCNKQTGIMYLIIADNLPEAKIIAIAEGLSKLITK